MMSRRLLTRVLAAVAAVAFVFHTASTNAAMMNFGTFVGNTVTFVDVTESNLDPDLHYDSVSVLNDTPLLDPTSFGVQVSPGPGSLLIDSELDMMILAQPGFTLDSISYAEEGDYTVAGDAEVADARCPCNGAVCGVHRRAPAPHAGEVEEPIGRREDPRHTVGASCRHIREPLGADHRSVRRPELSARAAVVGEEEQPSAVGCEVTRTRAH